MVYVSLIMLILLGLSTHRFSVSHNVEDTAQISQIPSTTFLSQPSSLPDIPSPTSTKSNTVWQSFIYPQSRVQSRTATRLELESPERVRDITKWYSAVLKKLAFSVRNVVQNQTNGAEQSVLSTQGDGQRISITIDRLPAQQTTHIRIDKESEY